MTLLEKEITANRAGKFREWHDGQTAETKQQLKSEIFNLAKIPPVIPSGISISEAAAIMGALIAIGIADGLNSVPQQ